MIIFSFDSPNGFWQCTSLLIYSPSFCPSNVFLFPPSALAHPLFQLLEGHSFCCAGRSSSAYDCCVLVWMSETPQPLFLSAEEPRFLTSARSINILIVQNLHHRPLCVVADGLLVFLNSFSVNFWNAAEILHHHFTSVFNVCCWIRNRGMISVASVALWIPHTSHNLEIWVWAFEMSSGEERSRSREWWR